jgi:hypothetical protein
LFLITHLVSSNFVSRADEKVKILERLERCLFLLFSVYFGSCFGIFAGQTQYTYIVDQIYLHLLRKRPIILAFLHGIEACPSILYVLDNIVHIFYMCCQLLFGGVCDLFSPYYLFFSSLFLQNFE